MNNADKYFMHIKRFIDLFPANEVPPSVDRQAFASPDANDTGLEFFSVRTDGGDGDQLANELEGYEKYTMEQ